MMGNKEYKVARKFVVEAHNLYPYLDGLDQMLTLCNVHCSAEKKFGENERHWYRILNCERTADEVVIKNQYHKLALKVHPDKNPFPGATNAFQLISKAKSVLVDHGERGLFDEKLIKTPGCIDYDFEEWLEFALPKFSNNPNEGSKMVSDVADQMIGNSSRLNEVDIDRYVGGSERGRSPQTFNLRDNLSFGIEPETRFVDYPEPEFNDFDKERAKNRFSAGQIWAAYDTLDAMPRFYALINTVVSTDFKLSITWLEPESNNESEITWINEGLPTSCGKFIPGSSEVIADHLIFSHVVSWRKRIGKRSAYEIYPRKGETWALFKNWDIKWCRDLKRRKDYEFNVVKILSDYDDEVGVYVGFLCKVNGFYSLYNQMDEEMNRKLIPVQDIFRFSHRVPSFQLTGNEGPNVPKMCFELDLASLPTQVPSSN
ncbi:hypothetical protein ACJIZ3_021505 [Penstemon smallii]|uniref:J domain-containing protein n=1 Tax=Penstemon smallii TaxID=265156 RepID=A0ABD3SM86_9LAMI